MLIPNLPSAALAAALMLALATPAAAAPTPDFVPGELIVRYEPGTTAAERIELRERHDARFERRLPLPGTTDLVRVEPGESVTATAAGLGREPDVAYAEPNFRYRVALTPDDAYFGRLWGLNNAGQEVNGAFGTADADIDAPEAWDLTTGSASVTVAVADSGVAYDHADLAPNLYANAGESGGGKETNGVDDDGNGKIDDFRGWDWVPDTDDNDPSDPNSHGTHVAGILGARGNDGAGVAGVSWNSKIMPLRILNASGEGSGVNLALAFRYAGTQGVQVVNASLGGAGFSITVYEAMEAHPNTLFVVAAGNGGLDQVGDDNDGGDPQTTTYPCADPPLDDHDGDPATAPTQPAPLPNLVCVAATDQFDNLPTFSNYGATSVDLAAPGTNIWSARPASLSGGDPPFSFKSGTSMATPFVSGAAALLWAKTPSATPAYVRAALLQSVDAKASLTNKVASGGRLNVLRALGTEPQVQEVSPSPAAAPATAPASEPPPATPASSPPPAPAPIARPADTRRPLAAIAVRRRQRLSSLLSTGLPVSCQADEASFCSLTLSVDAATAARLGLRVKRGMPRLALGTAQVRLGANTPRRVRLRLSTATRSALAKLARRGDPPTRFRAALETAVADRAGNSTTRRYQLTLLLLR